MSLSNSAMSYRDCYALMDRAVEADRGIRVKVSDMGTAQYLRLRCHKARAIARKHNSLTYEVGDPLHNASQYDILVIRLDTAAEGAWVVFDKVAIPLGIVEELEPIGEIEYQPMPQIESIEQRLLEGPREIADEDVEIIDPPKKSPMRRF